jgi:hypothetical protein
MFRGWKGTNLGLVRYRSGRIEARSGLRMMPTFPRSPRSFRTAGFPQYGWKAGRSSSAFLGARQLKPAPGIRCPTTSLHPLFVHGRSHNDYPALCRVAGSIVHRH